MPDLSKASLEEIVAELHRQPNLDYFVLFWKDKGEC